MNDKYHSISANSTRVLELAALFEKGAALLPGVTRTMQRPDTCRDEVMPRALWISLNIETY
jgi:hypothetical protein